MGTEERQKHPHGIHLLLFLVLLAVEILLFGGHGILYNMGSIGLEFYGVYATAQSGEFASIPMTDLALGVAGLIATLVIYYLIAGVIVILFKLLFKSFRRERVDI